MKKYPTKIIPRVQMPAKMQRSFGLTAFFSIIIDGRERVVTAIIKERTTPN